MKYLLLLLCLACRAPDEIGYTAGYSDSTFDNTARTGMDTVGGSVTITYHWGAKEREDAAEEARHRDHLLLMDALYRQIPEKSPVDLPKLEPPVPEPEPEPEDPIRFWPTATALAMAIATIVIKSKT